MEVKPGPCANGLKVPWQQNMVERFVQIGDELLAVQSDGQLLSAAAGCFGVAANTSGCYRCCSGFTSGNIIYC